MENEYAINMSLGYTAFLLGVSALFLFRLIAGSRSRGANINSAQSAVSDDAERSRVVIAANGLRDVAHNMACDVNAHRMLVENVSNRLGASLTADSPDEQLILNSTVELLDANFELQSRLAAAEEKIEAQAREITFRQREANTDPLTKLPNRRVFDARLAECLAEFGSSNTPFSVIMLDIDFFKQFNDAHGHVAGDEALRSVGAKLPQLIKRSDVTCRFGGEEFAVILRGARVLEAQAAANRLRAAIETMPIEVDGHSLRITISLGVAEAMPGEDIRRIVSRADACVYASKHAGRNCTHWHNGTDCIFASERQARAFDRGRSAASRLARLWRHRGDARNEEMPIIADRAVLVSLLQRRVAESARSGEPLSVLVLTLPQFEQLKQRLGEGEAGRIESLVISATAGAVRDMDYVGRLSEGEIAVLLPRCTESAAKIVAQRLTTVVRSALSGHSDAAKLVQPAIAISPAAHPITAEQMLELARQQRPTAAETARA